ncbi:MAG: hypothetical protein AAGF88_08805 [Pseudomonadota bacterium]
MAENEDPQPHEAEPEVITIRRTARVRRREAIVGWTQAVANVVVPITLGLAVWGFLQDLQRQKTNAADRQIELFYNEAISDARLVLFELWSDVDVSILNAPRARSFVDQFVDTVIDAQPENARDISAAIVSIASYFDQVETCIQRQRCDEAELVAQIGPYGRDFYCLYAGQLVLAREDSLLLSVGQGLMQFADRAGGCGAAAP